MTEEIETPAPLPPGEYAIIELFGHTTLVGRVAEVERFGTKMLAIEPLFNGSLLTPVFHGGAAVYRFTPCSAEVAFKRQPTKGYQLPPTILAIVPDAMLPAPPSSFADAVGASLDHGDPDWSDPDDEH